MAKIFKKLTVLDVRKHMKAGIPRLISDGDKLYLNVENESSASWTFIYQFKGRRRQMGLGGAGDGGLTLAEARESADEQRKFLRKGIDPKVVRDGSTREALASNVTFGKYADDYVLHRRTGWKNEKHARQWAMTLGDAYCKEIRSKPIGAITAEDISRILKVIWFQKPETASRVRMRIEKVLAAAKVDGFRSGENPAQWKGNLEFSLGKQSKKGKRHHSAMPFENLPQFMAGLRAMDSVSARALEFTILTAARTGEVIGARWEEIDFNKKIWTIPAARMKAGKEHSIPLSDAVTRILREMQGKSERWVFPGLLHDGPLSNMAMLMLLKGMGRTETVHGFRSSFRDWAAEKTAFQSEVAEMALAHAIRSGTEAAYRRGNLFEKRRPLMAAWAEYVMSGKVENVVPLITESHQH